MKLIYAVSSLSSNVDRIDQALQAQLLSSGIYDKEIPIPLRPNLIMKMIDYQGVLLMQRATRPVWIPCLIKHPARPYRSSTNRRTFKVHIVGSIIRVMDRLLQEAGYDMEIVTYNILPTSMSSGLIEIVPDSETLYHIKEQQHYTILNYLLEQNGTEPVDVVRQRFVRSTAAYCVMTYLLGIGDRHMDNIMVTKDGRLFHIDYSFVLGLDPKPLAPKMRITTEMIDALGGVNSAYYKQFEHYCTDIYNLLRRHVNLFTNMLSLLTQLDGARFSLEQLEIEISKRYLFGEYQSQAKIRLLKKSTIVRWPMALAWAIYCITDIRPMVVQPE